MRTTVLLLDADLLVRDTVEAMLTAINCAVVPVPDWCTAMAASTAICFDVLIALNVSQTVDVEQFLALKNLQPAIIIVAAEHAPGALSLHQADFRLRKPFGLEELRQAFGMIGFRGEAPSDALGNILTSRQTAEDAM